MAVTQETLTTAQSHPELNLTGPSDLRSDVEAKQTLVGGLLGEVSCDGLLVLNPDNFSWLTSGGAARGVLDAESLPALYFTGESRWALCANVDSQRLFDEELDGLGFQLKEWPWHWGRAQLLADLCQGRNTASDEPAEQCRPVGDALTRLRRGMSPYEAACYRALGQLLSHALDATGRTLARGETEREVAGQISHRLVRHGAQPLQVAVAADGRSRTYRQPAYTSTPIHHYCVLSATARKYGLCARASRSIVLGQPDAQFR